MIKASDIVSHKMARNELVATLCRSGRPRFPGLAEIGRRPRSPGRESAVGCGFRRLVQTQKTRSFHLFVGGIEPTNTAEFVVILNDHADCLGSQCFLGPVVHNSKGCPVDTGTLLVHRAVVCRVDVTTWAVVWCPGVGYHHSPLVVTAVTGHRIESRAEATSLTAQSRSSISKRYSGH